MPEPQPLQDLAVTKRAIRMPDGRTLIYYTFRAEPAALAPRPAPGDATAAGPRDV